MIKILRPLISVLRFVTNRAALFVSKRRTACGLPVWYLLPAGEELAHAIENVEQAVQLIADHDPRRFRRLRRDVRGIWVSDASVGAAGVYDSSLGLCLLDPGYLKSADATPELVAAIIVHEGTHARLRAMGVPYDRQRKFRVERVCLEAELAFAATIPGGDEIRRLTGYQLRVVEQLWSDNAGAQRGIRRSLELGAPEWLVRWIERHGKPAA